MKELKLEIPIEELSYDELPDDQRELVDTAIVATGNSFAPYSQFNVGAAIRLGDGRIIKGANQENAAFTAGLCAERTAIFAAQAQFPEQPIVQIAIAAKNKNGLMPNPVSPCGECRQVMVQIEDRYQRPMLVLLYGKDKIYRLKTVKDLMPLYFVDADMK